MSLHEFMVKETLKKPARCMKINSHPTSIFIWFLWQPSLQRPGPSKRFGAPGPPVPGMSDTLGARRPRGRDPGYIEIIRCTAYDVLETLRAQGKINNQTDQIVISWKWPWQRQKTIKMYQKQSNNDQIQSISEQIQPPRRASRAGGWIWS